MQLNQCPFCRGDAGLCMDDTWHNNCYRHIFGKCLTCGARGPAVLFGSERGLPDRKGDVVPDLEQAKLIAASRWNKRA